MAEPAYNDIQMVSTDHCPFCMKEQKEMGRGDFSKIPNGIGSVEHRMDLMYQGVVTGQISLERFVELTSTTPARMFGLYGRKGVIAPGADADIVVYDPLGPHVDRSRQNPPHEHGLLGLGGVRDRRSRRSGPVARNRDRRRDRLCRQPRTRAVPQTRPLSVPDLRWTSESFYKPIRRPARLVSLAKRAEEYGFSHVWTFDSPLLWMEPYVIYSQILAETRRITVGPFVTNPSTRDWTVTASVFATLNEMYGNRTICGIGRGDSAVRVLGRKPATVKQMREATHVIRELANCRSATVNGSELRFPWATSSQLEVWIAAYGPMALTAAGEVGDGFILQLGDVEIARWMIGFVRAAAAAAGRDPAAIKFCVAAPAYVTDGSRRQLAHAASSAAGSAGWWATTLPTSSADTAATERFRRR